MSFYYRFGGFNLPTPVKRIDELVVGDIWPNREIQCVATNSTIEIALKTLKERNILSVPVIDVSSNTCVGVLDILDIATFIAAVFSSVENVSLESLITLTYNGRLLTQEPVSDVFGFNKIFKPNSLPIFPVMLTTPLPQLIHVFSNGIHRLPVINDDNKIINFISQSDLLAYLAEHSYLLAQTGIASQTISQLGIWNTTVHFCKGDALVLHALKIMATASAMPIINDQGKLCGNFSISDLRVCQPKYRITVQGLSSNDFGELLSSVSNFLRKFNVKSLYPLACKTTDTLEFVIMKLVATRVHRLWVIDEAGTLVGVISLTDVMKPLIGIRMETSPAEFRVPIK